MEAQIGLAASCVAANLRPSRSDLQISEPFIRCVEKSRTSANVQSLLSCCRPIRAEPAPFAEEQLLRSSSVEQQENIGSPGRPFPLGELCAVYGKIREGRSCRNFPSELAISWAVRETGGRSGPDVDQPPSCRALANRGAEAVGRRNQFFTRLAGRAADFRWFHR